jgi:hypothetical protein
MYTAIDPSIYYILTFPFALFVFYFITKEIVCKGDGYLEYLEY